MTSTPAGSYGRHSLSTAFLQAYVDQEISAVVDLSPESLNTLNELAAAINDDPAFFATMATANADLQTNIDTLTSDAATARTNLQTLLQAAIDAVQADVDANETDADAAVTAEAAARGTALTNLQTTLQAAIDAVQSDVDQNETDSDSAESALSGRLDVLEADSTTATAVAAVQADVDQNETDGDAADLALSNRLDVLEADPTTKTYVDTQVAGLVDSAPGVLNTLDELAAALGDDANFATTITNSIAAVQADVDQNESDADSAIAAVQADVDQNEADADAAIALKLDIANPAATGDLTVDTNARLQFDSNLTKVENVLRGTSIDIGNNIQMKPAAPGGRVEVTGGLQIDITEVPEYSNDSQAEAGGVIVGGIYRSGSVLHIRVS